MLERARKPSLQVTSSVTGILREKMQNKKCRQKGKEERRRRLVNLRVTHPVLVDGKAAVVRATDLAGFSAFEHINQVLKFFFVHI